MAYDVTTLAERMRLSGPGWVCACSVCDLDVGGLFDCQWRDADDGGRWQLISRDGVVYTAYFEDKEDE